MSFAGLHSFFVNLLLSAQIIAPKDAGFFGNFWSVVGNLFTSLWHAICTLFYAIVKWFLAVLDFLQYFITRLIGLDYWQKSNGTRSFEGAVENDLLFSFIYDNTVQRVFRAMMGIFILLLIIFTVYSIIRQEWQFATGGFGDDGKLKSNSKVEIMRHAVKAIGLVLVFPMILMVGIVSSNAILASLANALNINGSETFGQTLFAISTQNANRYRQYANASRSAVSQKVTFYVDENGKAILYGDGDNSDYCTYYKHYADYCEAIYEADGGVGKATKYTVDSIIDFVNPKEETAFKGFCIGFYTNDEEYKFFMVKCGDGKEKEAMFYYLRNILGVDILKKDKADNKNIPNQDDARDNIHSELKNYMEATAGDVKGYISKSLDMTDFASGNEVIKACYNTWGYSSIYMTNKSFATSLDYGLVNNTYLNTMGLGGISMAKVMFNSDQVSGYFDGGQFGVVQQQAEYKVMADVVDFMNEKGATLYMVNATSGLIKWDYQSGNANGYHVDEKWVGKTGGGGLANISTSFKLYDNATPSETVSPSGLPFVVSYSDNCSDIESGNAFYFAEASETNELEGAKYIMCFKIIEGGKSVYIPLVHGKTFSQDGKNYTFKSQYLENSYHGVILAKGLFETNSTNASYGEPTYINTTVGGDIKASDEEEPYYYQMSQIGALYQYSNGAVITKTALKFEGITLPEDVKNDYSPQISGKDYDEATNIGTMTIKMVETANPENYGRFSESIITNMTVRMEVPEFNWTEHTKYDNLSFESKEGTTYYLFRGLDHYFFVELLGDGSIAIKGTNDGDYGLKYITIKKDDPDVKGSVQGVSVGYNLKYKYAKTGDGFSDVTAVDIGVGAMHARFMEYAKEDKDSSNNKYSVFQTIEKQYISYTDPSGTAKDEAVNVNIYFNTTKKSLIWINKDEDKLEYAVPINVDQDSDGEIDNPRIIQTTAFFSIDTYDYYTAYVTGNSLGLTYYDINNGKIYLNEATYNGLDAADKTSYEALSYFGGKKAITPIGDDVPPVKINANDFSWKTTETSYALYDGKKYVGTIYKNNGTACGTIAEFTTKSTSVFIDERDETYNNIITTNEYSDLSAMETQYGMLKESMIVGFYRDNAGGVVGGGNWFKGLSAMDLNFNLFGKFRLKFTLAPNRMTYADQAGYFKISEGIHFDYFFDDEIKLNTFFMPAKVSYWIILISSVLIIKVLGTALWGVIKRFYEITLYFIAMPAVASTIVLDGGTRFKKSIQDPLIAKVLSTYGVILGINAFFVLLTPVRSLSNVFTAEDIATSGSYFLKHLPITAEVLNKYIYIMFMLVAFTMIDSLPKIISKMIGAEDVVATGAETKRQSKEAMTSASDMISGRSAIRAGGELLKNATGLIPGSEFAKRGIDKIRDVGKAPPEDAQVGNNNSGGGGGGNPAPRDGDGDSSSEENRSVENQQSDGDGSTPRDGGGDAGEEDVDDMEQDPGEGGANPAEANPITASIAGVGKAVGEVIHDTIEGVGDAVGSIAEGVGKGIGGVVGGVTGGATGGSGPRYGDVNENALDNLRKIGIENSEEEINNMSSEDLKKLIDEKKAEAKENGVTIKQFSSDTGIDLQDKLQHNRVVAGFFGLSYANENDKEEIKNLETMDSKEFEGKVKEKLGEKKEKAKAEISENNDKMKALKEKWNIGDGEGQFKSFHEAKMAAPHQYAVDTIAQDEKLFAQLSRKNQGINEAYKKDVEDAKGAIKNHATLAAHLSDDAYDDEKVRSFLYSKENAEKNRKAAQQSQNTTEGAGTETAVDENGNQISEANAENANPENKTQTANAENSNQDNENGGPKKKLSFMEEAKALSESQGEAVGGFFSKIGDKVKGGFSFVKDKASEKFAQAGNFMQEKVFKPASNAVKTAASAVYGATLKPVVDLGKKAGQAIGSGVSKLASGASKLAHKVVIGPTQKLASGAANLAHKAADRISYIAHKAAAPFKKAGLGVAQFAVNAYGKVLRPVGQMARKAAIGVVGTAMTVGKPIASVARALSKPVKAAGHAAREAAQAVYGKVLKPIAKKVAPVAKVAGLVSLGVLANTVAPGVGLAAVGAVAGGVLVGKAIRGHQVKKASASTNQRFADMGEMTPVSRSGGGGAGASYEQRTVGTVRKMLQENGIQAGTLRELGLSSASSDAEILKAVQQDKYASMIVGMKSADYYGDFVAGGDDADIPSPVDVGSEGSGASYEQRTVGTVRKMLQENGLDAGRIRELGISSASSDAEILKAVQQDGYVNMIVGMKSSEYYGDFLAGGNDTANPTPRKTSGRKVNSTRGVSFDTPIETTTGEPQTAGQRLGAVAGGNAEMSPRTVQNVIQNEFNTRAISDTTIVENKTEARANVVINRIGSKVGQIVAMQTLAMVGAENGAGENATQNEKIKVATDKLLTNNVKFEAVRSTLQGKELEDFDSKNEADKLKFMEDRGLSVTSSVGLNGQVGFSVAKADGTVTNVSEKVKNNMLATMLSSDAVGAERIGLAIANTNATGNVDRALAKNIGLGVDYKTANASDTSSMLAGQIYDVAKKDDASVSEAILRHLESNKDTDLYQKFAADFKISDDTDLKDPNTRALMIEQITTLRHSDTPNNYIKNIDESRYSNELSQVVQEKVVSGSLKVTAWDLAGSETKREFSETIKSNIGAMSQNSILNGATTDEQQKIVAQTTLNFMAKTGSSGVAGKIQQTAFAANIAEGELEDMNPAALKLLTGKDKTDKLTQSDIEFLGFVKASNGGKLDRNISEDFATKMKDSYKSSSAKLAAFSSLGTEKQVAAVNANGQFNVMAQMATQDASMAMNYFELMDAKADFVTSGQVHGKVKGDLLTAYNKFAHANGFNHANDTTQIAGIQMKAFLESNEGSQFNNSVLAQMKDDNFNFAGRVNDKFDVQYARTDAEKQKEHDLSIEAIRNDAPEAIFNAFASSNIENKSEISRKLFTEHFGIGDQSSKSYTNALAMLGQVDNEQMSNYMMSNGLSEADMVMAYKKAELMGDIEFDASGKPVKGLDIKTLSKYAISSNSTDTKVLQKIADTSDAATFKKMANNLVDNELSSDQTDELIHTAATSGYVGMDEGNQIKVLTSLAKNDGQVMQNIKADKFVKENHQLLLDAEKQVDTEDISAYVRGDKALLEKVKASSKKGTAKEEDIMNFLFDKDNEETLDAITRKLARDKVIANNQGAIAGVSVDDGDIKNYMEAHLSIKKGEGDVNELVASDYAKDRAKLAQKAMGMSYYELTQKAEGKSSKEVYESIKAQTAFEDTVDNIYKTQGDTITTEKMHEYIKKGNADSETMDFISDTYASKISVISKDEEDAIRRQTAMSKIDNASEIEKENEAEIEVAKRHALYGLITTDSRFKYRVDEVKRSDEYKKAKKDAGESFDHEKYIVDHVVGGKDEEGKYVKGSASHDGLFAGQNIEAFARVEQAAKENFIIGKAIEAKEELAVQFMMEGDEAVDQENKKRIALGMNGRVNRYAGLIESNRSLYEKARVAFRIKNPGQDIDQVDEMTRNNFLANDFVSTLSDREQEVVKAERLKIDARYAAEMIGGDAEAKIKKYQDIEGRNYDSIESFVRDTQNRGMTIDQALVEKNLVKATGDLSKDEISRVAETTAGGITAATFDKMDASKQMQAIANYNYAKKTYEQQNPNGKKFDELDAAERMKKVEEIEKDESKKRVALDEHINTTIVKNMHQDEFESIYRESKRENFGDETEVFRNIKKKFIKDRITSTTSADGVTRNVDTSTLSEEERSKFNWTRNLIQQGIRNDDNPAVLANAFRNTTLLDNDFIVNDILKTSGIDSSTVVMQNKAVVSKIRREVLADPNNAKVMSDVKARYAKKSGTGVAWDDLTELEQDAEYEAYMNERYAEYQKVANEKNPAINASTYIEILKDPKHADVIEGAKKSYAKRVGENGKSWNELTDDKKNAEYLKYINSSNDKSVAEVKKAAAQKETQKAVQELEKDPAIIAKKALNARIYGEILKDPKHADVIESAKKSYTNRVGKDGPSWDKLTVNQKNAEYERYISSSDDKSVAEVKKIAAEFVSADTSQQNKAYVTKLHGQVLADPRFASVVTNVKNNYAKRVGSSGVAWNDLSDDEKNAEYEAYLSTSKEKSAIQAKKAIEARIAAPTIEDIKQSLTNEQINNYLNSHEEIKDQLVSHTAANVFVGMDAETQEKRKTDAVIESNALRTQVAKAMFLRENQGRVSQSALLEKVKVDGLAAQIEADFSMMEKLGLKQNATKAEIYEAVQHMHNMTSVVNKHTHIESDKAVSMKAIFDANDGVALEDDVVAGIRKDSVLLSNLGLTKNASNDEIRQKASESELVMASLALKYEKTHFVNSFKSDRNGNALKGKALQERLAQIGLGPNASDDEIESAMKQRVNNKLVYEASKAALQKKKNKSASEEAAAHALSKDAEQVKLGMNYAQNNQGKLFAELAHDTYFKVDKNGKATLKPEFAGKGDFAATIDTLSKSSETFRTTLYKGVTKAIDPTANISEKDRADFFRSSEVMADNARAQAQRESSRIRTVSQAHEAFINAQSSDEFKGAVFKTSRRAPKKSVAYDNWNKSIQNRINELKDGTGSAAGLSRQERQAEVLRLESQKIDTALPENYASMTSAQQSAYTKQQERNKKSALETGNYSKVYNAGTRVSSPNTQANRAFGVNNGREFTYQAEASKDSKTTHKQTLIDVDAKITRFNATKAVRNDSVEFGVNYNNFVKNYFNQKQILQLQRQSNNQFLDTFKDQKDKNGNKIKLGFKYNDLTEKQKEALQQIRKDNFAMKLNTQHVVASKKVARDNNVDPKTFLEAKGIETENIRYKNGTKKFTHIQSKIKMPESNDIYDVYMREFEATGGNVSEKTKRKYEKSYYGKRSAEAAVRNQNEAITLQKRFDEITEFNRTFKGTSAQYAEQFKQKFGSLAEDMYKRYDKKFGHKKLSNNLESNPVAVQQREVVKQIQEQIEKNSNRMKYASHYIPATQSNGYAYVGKTLTGAKTSTEIALDRKNAEDLNRAYKMATTQSSISSFDSMFNRLLPKFQEGYNNNINRVKSQLKIYGDMNDEQKKLALQTYLRQELAKANKRVANNSFLRNSTDKLTALNGVRVDRSKMAGDATSQTMMRALEGSQYRIYQGIVQNYNSAVRSYEAEKANMLRLGRELQTLKAGPQTAKTRVQEQRYREEINASKLRMERLRSVIDLEGARKKSYEHRIIETQMRTSARQNANLGYNVTRSVLDSYRFPIVGPDGRRRFVEPGSMHARHIDRIIGRFMMNYRNQIQNMVKSMIYAESVEMRKHLANLSAKMTNDFGKTVRDLQRTKQMLRSQIEKLKNKTGKLDAKDRKLREQLENYEERLNKTDTELRDKLTKLGVDVAEVSVKK